MKQQELSVLSNVIAVARRELADREDKEIPSRLRRVAKRGGRRLPPPFQASIVKELRTDDAFRESVLERWESEGMEDTVGNAFLTDPEAGIDKVMEQAQSRHIASLQTDLDLAAQTIQSLEGQMGESKVRLAETARGHKADLARRDASAAASRVSLDTSVCALRARIAELEADQGSQAAMVAELRSEIDELTGKLERSIARAHKKAQKDHVKVRRPMSPPTDPLEFATWLDTVERQQRSFRKARGTEAGIVSDRPPPRIPGGLLPDSREALSALIDQRPDVVYIDGYNVGALLVEEVGTSRSRTSVVAIADRLATASRARVVVVFDAVGVEGPTRAPSLGGAEVRFTHSQIADDEIVEMIQTNPSRAAVITSDRELSDRCADLGCMTVWSESLVKWAGR